MPPRQPTRGPVLSVLHDGQFIHPKARSSLKPGNRLTIRCAGGGGYGPPDGRDQDRVLSDLRHGYITESAACEVYKLI